MHLIWNYRALRRACVCVFCFLTQVDNLKCQNVWVCLCFCKGTEFRLYSWALESLWEGYPNISPIPHLFRVCLSLSLIFKIRPKRLLDLCLWSLHFKLISISFLPLSYFLSESDSISDFCSLFPPLSSCTHVPNALLFIFIFIYFRLAIDRDVVRSYCKE